MQYPEKINWLGMHELLHFFTWIKYRPLLKAKGVSDEHYNTIKESLTVLLNTEYKDLMGDEFDKGYPQH